MRKYRLLYIVQCGDDLLSKSKEVSERAKVAAIREINNSSLSIVTGVEPVRPIRQKKI